MTFAQYCTSVLRLTLFLCLSYNSEMRLSCASVCRYNSFRMLECVIKMACYLTTVSQHKNTKKAWLFYGSLLLYYCSLPSVICHMEGSGKWPNDCLAIRHIKTAFHIRLGELLKQQHDYTNRPTPTHLDVWKVVYLFYYYFKRQILDYKYIVLFNGIKVHVSFLTPPKIACIQMRQSFTLNF